MEHPNMHNCIQLIETFHIYETNQNTNKEKHSIKSNQINKQRRTNREDDDDRLTHTLPLIQQVYYIVIE